MGFSFNLSGEELSVSIYDRMDAVKIKHFRLRNFVYGLIENGQVNYIGATKSIYARIMQHRANIGYAPYKPFDSFILIEYPTKEIALMQERKFISELLPKYNCHFNKNWKKETYLTKQTNQIV